MDLYALATQMGTALGTVTPALRVYPYGASKIEAPAAVITMPDEYRPANYSRAAMSLKGISVWLCVRGTAAGRPQRASLKQLYQWTGDTAPASVVKAVEGYAYTACVPGTMAWQRTAFDVQDIAGSEYLTALITFDAEGVAT
jgi:hypothetical protein